MGNRPHRQTNCSVEFIPRCSVDLKFYDLFHALAYGFLTFQKESNFGHFLFAFLEDEAFSNRVSAFKEMNLPLTAGGGGRVVRRWWVNFQCRGVLLIWMIVGRARAYCACTRCGWGSVDIFSLVYLFSFLSLFLSLSLCKTAPYRLKYCLKVYKQQ